MKSCSIPCWLSPTAPCWILSCRTPSLISAARRALSRSIKGEGASKSGELAEALAGGKKIVVCTIQTFPFALKAVQDLAATQGKRFAVIADEAHSSQTGEAAAKLKALLSAEELHDLADGGEVSTEDLLAAQMAGAIGRTWHHLRRLHRYAEGQDSGAVWPPTRPRPAGQRHQPAGSRFMSIRCARRSRKASSSMY